ncbi:alpha/beta hydrolase [Streptomyces sp. NPDC093982]|uniref:alpha/beta hydrolase n=1 Tax=Streptomyces sp. NPDC093982 TaxID=3155077 RepID=UPI0034386F58
MPLDWTRPQGATIQLTLSRRLATDPAQRIGSLLLLAGGPGGSGVDWALDAQASFSSGLRARFDIVGFDGRGTGRSNPILCDGELSAARGRLMDPQDAAQFTALRQTNQALVESCRTLSGPIVDHMDSASVVRDMEAIRAALGEERLSYYGVSYGTLPGQQYAEQFPRRVRAAVLDANMDHSLDNWGIQKTSSQALEEALGQFADWCARTPDCALHGRDVRKLYASLYKKAEAGQLSIFTAKDLGGFAFGHVASSADWYTFAQVLASLNAGQPGAAQGALAPLPDRRIHSAPHKAPSRAAKATTPSCRPAGQPCDTPPAAPAPLPLLQLHCADFNLTLPDHAAVAGFQRKLARIAPLTRHAWQSWNTMIGCQGWSTKPSNPPHRLNVDGAPPILLTNSRYDVRTPYSWAVNVARQIGKQAVLLTYDGVAHDLSETSPCMRDAADKYLIDLTPPRKGTHCPAEWPTNSSARPRANTP